jgi:hypothetical protein
MAKISYRERSFLPATTSILALVLTQPPLQRVTEALPLDKAT